MKFRHRCGYALTPVETTPDRRNRSTWPPWDIAKPGPISKKLVKYLKKMKVTHSAYKLSPTLFPQWGRVRKISWRHVLIPKRLMQSIDDMQQGFDVRVL